MTLLISSEAHPTRVTSSSANIFTIGVWSPLWQIQLGISHTQFCPHSALPMGDDRKRMFPPQLCLASVLAVEGFCVFFHITLSAFNRGEHFPEYTEKLKTKELNPLSSPDKRWRYWKQRFIQFRRQAYIRPCRWILKSDQTNLNMTLFFFVRTVSHWTIKPEAVQDSQVLTVFINLPLKVMLLLTLRSGFMQSHRAGKPPWHRGHKHHAQHDVGSSTTSACVLPTGRGQSSTYHCTVLQRHTRLSSLWRKTKYGGTAGHQIVMKIIAINVTFTLTSG